MKDEKRLKPGKPMFVPRGKIVKLWVNESGVLSEVCITYATEKRKRGLLIWVTR